MKNILVAVDFEPCNRKVIKTGAELAGAFGSSLHLVHVVPPRPDLPGYEPVPQSAHISHKNGLHEERVRLRQMADVLASSGVEARPCLLKGEVVERLLEQAGECDADAIVMGNHCHGMVRKVILGSACEGVLKKARCPVVVVPAPAEAGE